MSGGVITVNGQIEVVSEDDVAKLQQIVEDNCGREVGERMQEIIDDYESVQEDYKSLSNICDEIQTDIESFDLTEINVETLIEKLKEIQNTLRCAI